MCHASYLRLTGNLLYLQNHELGGPQGREADLDIHDAVVDTQIDKDEW